MKLAIRVDAGTNLGMGHLMRCVSIARQLPPQCDCHFYLLETDAPVYDFLHRQQLPYTILKRTANELQDAQQMLEHIADSDTVLLDSYSLQTVWQQEIKKHGHLLYVIDDLHAWHHVADHVINHSGGVKSENYSCENYTQLHIGYAFRMLRPAFMHGPAKRDRLLQFPGHVLISMGASDVPNNTLKMAEACLSIDGLNSIHLLVSRLNPHYETLTQWTNGHAPLAKIHEDLSDVELYQLMSKCDTLICPASTIALEGCCVGMIVLTGITADNQFDNYHGLIDRNLAYPLGKLNDVDEVAIVDEILKIFAQPHKALTMVEKQMEVFDIAQHQLPLLFEPNALRLRRATMNDLMTLYNWTNDPDVRLNSFDSNPIPLDAHTHWLAQKLQDENTVLFILHSDTLEFGVIRFTRQNEEATIHFSIATEHRGKGLGKKIIALGEQLVQSHWPQIRRFIALVKTENQASLKSFENYQRAELNDHLVLTKEIH